MTEETRPRPRPDGPTERRPARPARRSVRGHAWLTLVTLSVGAMMVSLDGMIVAVAQPAMQSALGADLTGIQWVTNGYLLTVAALLITAGKVGDRFGHRNVFLIGVAGFTAASVAIGLSGSLGWVIGLRIVQGAFGALMQPATLGLLRSAFPAERLNMPIAVRSAVIAASTAAGPVVGGLIVEHADWSWVFFLNVPLGAIALALGLTVLRDVRADGAVGRFDVTGMVVLAGALCSLVWGLAEVPHSGWADTVPLLALMAGALLLTGFVWWQGHAADPLVPLRIFRSVRFSVGVFTMVVMGFVMVAAPFVLVFYLQNVLGLTPAQSGVRVLALTLLMIVGAPPAAMWISRSGPRTPVVLGLGAIAAAMAALSQLDARTGTLEMTLYFFLLGVGFSPVMVGGTKLVMSSAPMELSGVAGGMQQTAMQIGGSLGVATAGTVIAAHTASVLPGRLAAHGLVLSPEQADTAARKAAVGLSPDLGLPGATRELLARVSQSVFLEGMQYALLATAAVAAAGALAGLAIGPGKTAQHQ
ncbi:DHA2 family efflux MFS transporter permease subunit [Streptomyces seoulensis]|uniref:DHA2 family efflux MFS transporter permease subunit n=1 Tax=Streptomyces seoulensis TaxID=73044 RepID=A0A4P6TU64_STRSO|nr:MFS transporter [Streptomyces seoulensis]QBJ90989.1 DHA2 family efflux MFS transporter permease subunit [Streptomyces seoulensis]